MKVVLEKSNLFLDYNIGDFNGFSFKPKKNINNLNIIDKKMIKTILKKKISKNINSSRKSIKLMLESGATIPSDCDMMMQELNRILIIFDSKYRTYFNEFEYFDLVNDIYQLNMEIKLKKNLLDEE